MRTTRIIPLLLAMTAAGCSSGGGETAGKSASSGTGASGGPVSGSGGGSGKIGLIPARNPPVGDLPVPLGFKMDESTSRSYESAGSRYVDHTFEGRSSKVEVEQFIRQQMPLKGWTFRGSQMVRGTYVLRYEKGSEFCDVTIVGSDNPILGPSSTLSYNLQTVGKGEPPSGKK
jgi:hypothetical protein